MEEQGNNETNYDILDRLSRKPIGNFTDREALIFVAARVDVIGQSLDGLLKTCSRHRKDIRGQLSCTQRKVDRQATYWKLLIGFPTVIAPLAGLILYLSGVIP